jgi:DNA-binding NarL/FixJ family response regulator
MLDKLTGRENEVLKLIADGLTNREISRYLSISESTVENHIHNIYDKLGIAKRTQAVVYAYQTGMVLVHEVLKNRGNPS